VIAQISQATNAMNQGTHATDTAIQHHTSGSLASTGAAAKRLATFAVIVRMSFVLVVTRPGF